MLKSVGHPRISIPGQANIINRVAVIKIGGKLIEDIIKDIRVETPRRITVTDIEALTAGQIEALRCGDVVIKQTGTQQHAYTVAYKDDTAHEIALVYADAWNVEEVYYDKSVGDAWSMIEKKITAIATPAE